MTYHITLPDGTPRTVSTALAFWQAIDDSASWYLCLPAEEQVRALEAYQNENTIMGKIGAAIADHITPTTLDGYRAFLQLLPDVWETSYPYVLLEDDEDPTPRHVFDLALAEMVKDHLFLDDV